MSYKEEIDLNRIPQHVAIIMDGNGRWAKQRGHERSYGHQAGAETVHVIAEEAAKLGVRYLTLYTFSTENWNRPSDEVAALMGLLFDSIEEETFMKNNISFRVIGDIEKLPANVQQRLNTCVAHTSHNTGMCLVLALSYSSRWEITEAARQIADLVQKGELKPEQIDSELISRHLTTHFMPDPDLLIRTGGELRLSNYMLWQCAYSELYFCDTYWPDFREEELRKAISEKEKAAYEAELLKKEEIHKAEETIRKEKDEEIAALQKQLFDMQTRQLSDQAALQEAKTALLSLRLELSQAHQKELNEVRIEKDKKIEALQNELLKAFDKK